MNRSNLPAFPASRAMMLSPATVPLQYVNPGLSLAQILAILAAHRKHSLIIAACIISLSCLIIKIMPRSYAATATLMLNYQVNDPLGGVEFPIGLLGSYMATQIDLMQSSAVLYPVIEQLKLTSNHSYTAGYKGDGSTLNDWVQKKLVKRLSVEQGRFGSQLIYVTYATSNPNEAAQVANAVADIYSDQQYQRLTGPASDRAVRYTAQLEELKTKVSQAQDQVTNFRQRTGLVSSDIHVDVDMEMLSNLEGRLLEAQNLERAAEVRTSADQTVAGAVLSSTLIQQLKSQLAAEESKLAELRATLGPRHPQVLELQSQINSTRSSLSAELQTYTSNASSEFGSAKEMVVKLQGAVDDQKAKVLGLRQLQDEAAKYNLELESAQTVYKRALDSYDQIMVASNSHYTNISLISRAVPPLRANKPKTLTLLLAACVAALLAGICGPLAYELLTRRVRCRDDLERDHGIPVLSEFEFHTTNEALA